MAGQSLGDRIVAAQHTLVGSDMTKSVCKASTSELMGPKKKHLAYLQALTNEQNINIPDLADALLERSKQQKWVVVFKSLITTHHLMCYGNERFIQHLASRNSLYSLSGFLDKTAMQGYDMSTYIRKYSQYLNEKAVSYRTVAYDFTRIKRGKDGMLRSLEADKLIKALPVLQKQIDCLLEFDAQPNDLINGVINAAFLLLFKDLIRLFACYNDGIINLLEKYFTMKKSQCKESLDLYKKFLTRMNKVSEMLKVAEQVGIDKGDIPDLTKAPSSLLDALEQHLAHMDGKKAESSAATSANLSTFTSMSSTLNKMDVNAQQIALDEEKSKLEAFKKQREEELQKQNNSHSTPTQQPQPVQVQPPPAATTSNSASSDLLEIFGSSTTTAAPAASGFGESFNAFPQSNFGMPAQQAQPFGNAAQSQSFGNAVQPQSFGNAAQPQGFAFGSQQQQQQQQPFGTSAAGWGLTSQTAPSGGDAFAFNQTQATTQQNLFENSPFQANPLDSPGLGSAGLLQPTRLGQDQQVSAQCMQQPQTGGNQNLESSLASAMANLTVAGQRANQNFQPKTEKKLTGGANYNPTITPSPMTINTTPMNPMATAAAPTQGNVGMYGNNMMWNNTGMSMPMQAQQPGFGMPYQQPQMRMLNPNNPFGSM